MILPNIERDCKASDLLFDLLKRKVHISVDNEKVSGTLLTYIENSNHYTLTLQESTKHLSTVDISFPYNVFVSGGCYIFDYRIDSFCGDDADLYAYAKVFASTSQTKDICFDRYLVLSAS